MYLNSSERIHHGEEIALADAVATLTRLLQGKSRCVLQSAHTDYSAMYRARASNVRKQVAASLPRRMYSMLDNKETACFH